MKLKKRSAFLMKCQRKFKGLILHTYFNLKENVPSLKTELVGPEHEKIHSAQPARTAWKKYTKIITMIQRRRFLPSLEDKQKNPSFSQPRSWFSRGVDVIVWCYAIISLLSNSSDCDWSLWWIIQLPSSLNEQRF